ncbi:tail fiber protein [Flavobacterium sp. 17A]|uniref:Tail fiber protein n=1 Tax=Flavobacterium potami TaxID=2872310 RepID=A0A9X1HFU6_9FLAO|nr:tail fiber protein [Flavobacterium potami]MBZ4037607.1 tail fiber protein [Flavobacterium potami]
MKKKYFLILVISLLTISTYAQDTPILGEIRIFPGKTVPRGWMRCEGQILNVMQNQALYSLLGNSYGGSPGTTFALPDLRERMPVGVANTTNWYPFSQVFTLGMKTEGNKTIALANLPAHTHNVSIMASSNTGNSKTPSSALSIAAPVQFFNNSTRNITYYNNSAPDITLPVTSLSISTVGSGSPVVQQPILVTNYCIAVLGIYPSRN